MSTATESTTPLQRIWKLLVAESKNIRFLYIYAIFSGAISLVIPLGIQALMSMVIGGRLSSGWVLLVFFIGAGVLFAGITRLAQISILENIQQRMFVGFALRFARVLGESNLSQNRTGHQTLSEKFLDVITLQKSFTKLILDFSASLLQILFGLILLVIYHPSFLFFGFGVLVTVSLVLRLTWKSGIQTSRTESDYKFKTAHWINEITRNKSVFRMLAKPYHLIRTEELVQGYVASRKLHFRIIYRQATIAIIMKVILTIALVVLGSWLLINESISLGQFLASEILIITLLNAVEKLIVTVENIYDSGIALEKLGSIADHEEPMPVGHLPADSSHKTGIGIQISGADGAFTNLQIEPGAKVSLCAVPGSGRTRLLKAILGEKQNMYKVLLNGVAAVQIAPKFIGANTAICFQSSTLFDGTIAENVVLHGVPDYSRLQELGNLLNLSPFIAELDNGWDYRIDAEDLLVPNNIAKKILLARALYPATGLILLDDIWAVFNKNELENIMEYIVQLPATVVVVSNLAPVLSKMHFCLYSNGNQLEYAGKGHEFSSNPKLSQIVWQ